MAIKRIREKKQERRRKSACLSDVLAAGESSTAHVEALGGDTAWVSFNKVSQSRGRGARRRAKGYRRPGLLARLHEYVAADGTGPGMEIRLAAKTDGEQSHRA